MSKYDLGTVYAGLKKAKEGLAFSEAELIKCKQQLADTYTNKNGRAHDEEYIASRKRCIALMESNIMLYTRAIKLDEQFLEMNAQLIEIERKLE